MKPGCPLKCSLCKNKRKFSPEVRQSIFNQFWNFGDHARRGDFILKNLKCNSPKKRTGLPGREKKQKKTRRGQERTLSASKAKLIKCAKDSPYPSWTYVTSGYELPVQNKLRWSKLRR